MMHKLRLIAFIVLATFVASSCVQNKNPQQAQSVAQANQNVFEVTEVVQGSTYTYLNVKENMADRWVAVSHQEAKPGDVFYYDEALQMTNFHSKEIDRTFDVIYFVNQISKTPLSQQQPMAAEMPAGHSGKVAAKSAEVELEKAEGELTVSEVFAKRAEFSNQEFEIRGVVVKVNEQVMGKNWVHIQDGTSSEGKFDLTITTQAEVEVGDEVTFKGKLTLEKDFGAGYFYDVIMEDGTLVTKKVS
ncbi:hypothetical protein [Maribellus sp. YY47]|uniref:hypothetical protein n=1 Tax=Maribellus sp. YY47 TaxID=2929486 RepID=UPI0020019A4B|nr:hypothetical protein [Maribellus sp. YY47]MCK3685791.1 hypothetical protein [Maribellus sp. YY47]